MMGGQEWHSEVNYRRMECSWLACGPCHFLAQGTFLAVYDTEEGWFCVIVGGKERQCDGRHQVWIDTFVNWKQRGNKCFKVNSGFSVSMKIL